MYIYQCPFSFQQSPDSNQKHMNQLIKVSGSLETSKPFLFVLYFLPVQWCHSLLNPHSMIHHYRNELASHSCFQNGLLDAAVMNISSED